MDFFAVSPRLVGHRGAGDYAALRTAPSPAPPENTAAACRLGLELGADSVEIDVQRTADDRLVVVNRSRTPDGQLVHELTLAELQQRGCIEPLAQLVSELPIRWRGAPVGLNLEIKTGYSQDESVLDTVVATALAEEIPTIAARWPVMVSSFDPAAIRTVAQRISAGALPQLPLGLILTATDVRDRRTPIDIPEAIRRAREAGATVVQAHGELLGCGPLLGGAEAEASIATIHEAGLRIVTWGTTAALAAELAAAGADAVCVNDIAETADLMRRRPQ